MGGSAEIAIDEEREGSADIIAFEPGVKAAAEGDTTVGDAPVTEADAETADGD